MADTDRIKRNIRKMIDMGAPENEIDGYIQSEGVTLEQLRGAPERRPSAVADVAKSFGTGLAEGAIGVAGLPGTAADMLKGGANWLIFDRIFGKQPDEIRTGNPLSARAIQGAIEDNVTGEFYKPQTTAGEYANTVGEFIPGALLGGGGTAKELGKTALKFGVVPGVASEAAGQATEGTALEPYARAAAAIGTGVGVSMLPGVKLSRTPKEARLLARSLGDDGITSGNVRSRMSGLGDEAMTMDLGPNAQRQAGALAATPGNAQTIVRKAVTDRADTAKTRIQGQLDDTLGKAPLPNKVADEITGNMQALEPQYTAIFKGAKPVDTSKLAADIEGMIRSQRGDPQKALRDVRKMLDVQMDSAEMARLSARTKGPVTVPLDTDPGSLLRTRQAIDQIIGEATTPNVEKALTPIRQRIDGILQASVPGIKKVDAMAQDLIRQRKAVEQGQQVLDSGRTAPRPAEVADMMSPVPAGDMIGPSGAPLRLSQGTLAEIERIVGTNSSDVRALKQLLKGEGSWNRDRLVSIFGERKADRIFRIVENELQYAKTRAVVDQNSESAARIAAMQEVSPNNLGANRGAIRSAMNFNFGDAGAAVIDWATSALRTNLKNATNERLANLLTQTARDPSKVEAALRMVEAARVAGSIPAEMAALLVNTLTAARIGSQPSGGR